MKIEPKGENDLQKHQKSTRFSTINSQSAPHMKSGRACLAMKARSIVAPMSPKPENNQGERFIKERAYSLGLQFGLNAIWMPNCSWIKLTSKRAWDKPNEIKPRFDFSDPHSKIHAVRNWNGMSASQIHSDPNEFEQRRTVNESQTQNTNVT